jgi:hypothetical protein
MENAIPRERLSFPNASFFSQEFCALMFVTNKVAIENSSTLIEK